MAPRSKESQTERSLLKAGELLWYAYKAGRVVMAVHGDITAWHELAVDISSQCGISMAAAQQFVETAKDTKDQWDSAEEIVRAVRSVRWKSWRGRPASPRARAQTAFFAPPACSDNRCSAATATVLAITKGPARGFLSSGLWATS